MTFRVNWWLMSGFALLLSLPHYSAAEDHPAPLTRAPQLDPDYAGIVIPPNIAALNFVIRESGAEFRVCVRSRNGHPVEATSRNGTISFGLKPWRQLLAANAGQELYLDVSQRDSAGGWQAFQTVTNRIAPTAIDGYLVYRLLGAVYNYYSDLGIYQRDLASFRETEVLHNRLFKGGCVNCHTFAQNRADPMAMNIRLEGTGNPLLVVRSNRVTSIAQTAGYLSWHPSGRLLAFSANKLSQFFHTIGEARDIFDADSDLRIFRVDSNQVVTPLPVALPDRMETWPAWSADGRFLYFCSAPKQPFEKFRQVQYDLVRVFYDLETDTWGSPETMVAAADWHLTASLPRPSPDGRFLAFCFSNYGSFPVHKTSTDLYCLDLSTRKCRRLDINSDQADTWHSWSSNSRWLVFSSKRRDGLFARPYLSYVDEEGCFHKPFLLPQEDPTFYDTFLKTYNLPELVQHPVRVPQGDLAKALLNPAAAVKPKTEAGASPKASGLPQGSEEEAYLKK